MLKSKSVTRKLKQLAASSLLAITMLSSGALTGNASAQDLPAWGEGVVITPASASPGDVMEIKPAANFKRGKVVPFGMAKPAGTIVVNTRKNVLYYVLGNGQAVQFRVATAKRGFRMDRYTQG